MQSLVEFMNRDRLKKYKITKPEYHYFPKSYESLKILIQQLIKERGLESDLNDIDTSEIWDMSQLFMWSSFNGDISQWDTSSVLDMSQMFYNSSFDGDISQWDVSRVKDTDRMFLGCPLESHPPKWYTD